MHAKCIYYNICMYCIWILKWCCIMFYLYAFCWFIGYVQNAERNLERPCLSFEVWALFCILFYDKTHGHNCRGLWPKMTSAVTKQSLLVMCRVMQTTRSFLRHLEIAREEITMWPGRHTFIWSCSKLGLASFVEYQIVEYIYIYFLYVIYTDRERDERKLDNFMYFHKLYITRYVCIYEYI